MGSIPPVTFLVKKNNIPWLLEKRDYLEHRWKRNNDGLIMLRRITRVCNLPFPKSIESIDVTLEAYYRCNGLLGFTQIDNPSKITLYVKKSERYSSLKSTLCHEVIHSLCWCNTVHDQRRTSTSYFADIFADELLTTMLEAYIVKGKMTKGDYEWALDYARKGICETLKNLKRSGDYRHFVDELSLFLKHYKIEIRKGSNLLLQRQKVLTYIRSPNDA